MRAPQHPATGDLAHQSDGAPELATFARVPYVIWRRLDRSVSTHSQAFAPPQGFRDAFAARVPLTHGAVSGRRSPPRGGLLRRGKARADAAVHGVGIRDLAARRARHRRPLPVGTPLVARPPARGAGRERRASPRRRRVAGGQSGRPAGREHGRARGGRASVAPAGRAERRAGPHGPGRGNARGARGRHGDQRHDGHPLDAGRRGDRRRRRADLLADLVARRYLGRTGRPSAHAHVGPGSRSVMAARPYVGGRRDRRDRGRARPPRPLDRRAGDLHGLPGVDLGGLPIRAAGRVRGDRGSSGCGDRRDRQRGRAVL